ncbi:MAG TPA: restriction endonuclease [Gemmataceae bacterium]|nr:restriction endonuclease [Gemmataceae bacterium]
MPSQYPYHTTICNEYLGVRKVIKAMTRSELQWLVDCQHAKWNEEEKRKREQKQKEADRKRAQREAEALKDEADLETEAATKRIDSFREILATGLNKNLAPDWESMVDRSTFPPFHFREAKPDLEAIRLGLLGPEPKEEHIPAPRAKQPDIFEVILPFLRRKRLRREAEAHEDYERRKKRARSAFAGAMREYQSGSPRVKAAYNAAVAAYNGKLKEAKHAYDAERMTYLAKQEAHNRAVLGFRERYRNGAVEAVERYAQMALENSEYPEGVSSDPDVLFDDVSRLLVINSWVPNPTDIPRIVEHRYIASRREIRPIEMKPKEFDALYDDVIHQIALRTVHEVLVADHAAQVGGVVFNGWVRGIDTKTGRPFTSCILSYQAPRQQFLDLDLTRVSPRECIRAFKGLTAGPLAMLAPVKPILDINREDDRFVESKEVLGYLHPETNLAAMAWEDFEHLVRELFEKEFAKHGGEVRVTQASRDRGVDAIAFDPDPIRGGKFVIQAKRYNVVVPVSAVRDLYGTMIAEGAAKGILVTTSYFGHDSREFAKDKPISLLDGENLVHMFQKHGRDVHIALLPKGDPRRGAI